MTKLLGLTILCIGTDLVNLNLRCSALKEHGWNVISAGNGHDGLFRVSRQPVHLVVLDLNDDGAESAVIAAELKRLQPDIPVIMLVGDRTKLMAGATDLADAVVSKAEEQQVLAHCIQELWGNT